MQQQVGSGEENDGSGAESSQACSHGAVSRPHAPPFPPLLLLDSTLCAPADARVCQHLRERPRRTSCVYRHARVNA